MCERELKAIGETDHGEPQRLQDLAKAAEKDKANLVRKRIRDEKADITCR